MSSREDERCFQVALSVVAFSKCSPNLSTREQPLPSVLDVLGAGWVGIWDPAVFCSGTPRACRKQDQRCRAASLEEQGTRHHPPGDPPAYRKQAGDSQHLTSCCQFWAWSTRLPRLSTNSWNGHWSISLQSNRRLSICAYTSQDLRSLTSTNLHPLDSHQWPSRHFHAPVCMLATSTASTSDGFTVQNLLMVRAWFPGQMRTTLRWCTQERI